MSTHGLQFDRDGGREPPDEAVLAAEYVLGLTDPEVRSRLQARIGIDPGFTQQVQVWEKRFAPLFDEIAPMAVAAHLWPRIRTQLGWSPMEGAQPGVWQSVTFWRSATALAAAAALAAVVVGYLPKVSMPTQPSTHVVVQAWTEQARSVTTLAHDDGSPGWLATLDAAHGTAMMVPVPAQADVQGRVPELWLIPAGQAPRSLGLVSTDKAHTVVIPPSLRHALIAGSTLAVTLEPAGGAPRGIPTGPIIAKGSLSVI